MKMAENSTRAFTEALASESPAPGGGGASALVGAVGTALASMSANLTVGKKKYAEHEGDLAEILAEASKLREELLLLIDGDAECFEPLSKAYGIPKDDPKRDEIMENALRLACTVPLEIMKASARAIDLHARLEQICSRLMLSDVAVGVLCSKTALQGASMNIIINLRSMKDEAYASVLRSETEELLGKYCMLADETYEKVVKILS